MGFHMMLTLGYLIPGLYLFFRIRKLFIPGEYRYLYIIIFTILFLVYPLSNLEGEDNASLIAQIIVVTANYLLPFFLYLFLLLLLTDLLLLANLIFRIIPREKIRGRALRLRVFISIVCFSAVVVIGGVINFNTIRITEYRISVPKKSSDINHFRIAFISDFHLQESTPAGFVNRAIRKIEEVHPDIMIFGGDIIEGHRQDENMQEYESLLSSIKTKYGIYGVLGNHEHYAGKDRGGFFDKAGISILSDTVITIGNSFILAGRNDSHSRTRKSIDELFRSVPDSLPVILLDHRPNEIKEEAGTKTDILLCGHTHNGQLFPINFITGKVYELSTGYKRYGNTHVFVSSGIRLWGPPVRTVGRSEIVVIDVDLTR